MNIMNRLCQPILLLVIFSLCLSSCGEITYSGKVNHLVGEYINVKNIVIEQLDNNCCKLSYDENNVISYDYLSESSKLKYIFDSLSIKHSDISYKGRLSDLGGSSPFRCLATDFISINVTSTKDYNATHPANSSLNDIVKFLSVSCYPFIKSNYTAVFYTNIVKDMDAIDKKYLENILIGSAYTSGFKQFDIEGNSITPFSPISKQLDRLTKDDLILIGFYGTKRARKSNYIGFLYFTEHPDVLGDYEIKVEMVGDNGKTYTATTAMKFE